MSRCLRLLTIALAGITLVSVFAFGSYKIQLRQLERRAFDELTWIARMKAEHVTRWREGRKADAELLRTIPTLVESASADRVRGHAHLEVVLDWMRSHFAGLGYRHIDVLDPADPLPGWPGGAEMTQRARRAEGILISPVFLDEHGHVALQVVAPILDRSGTASGYVLMLSLDPSTSLFKSVQSWPSVSASAESLLVTREGNDVVYLNDLRHWRGTAVRLRRPAQDAALPEARAVTGRPTSPGELLYDYRGTRVVAATAPVPGSDWALVAKMDHAEAQASLQGVLAWTWTMLGGVLFGVFALVMWQHERRTAAALRQASRAREVEERLAIAVSAAGIALWDWNVAEDRIFASAEYKAQLGYGDTELDVTFADWEDRLHPEDRARALSYVRRYLAHPVAEFAQEVRLRHRDGSYRHILVRAVGRTEDGRVTRLLGCHLDVTPMKQLEEQLRQAQKMEAVGRLAGGVAHDFNNVLMVIRGYVDLLLSSSADSGVKRDLEEIQRAASSAERLTRQLLVFSRKAPSQRAIIDLNVLLRDWRKLLGRALGEDVELEIELDPAPACVFADPGQVEQAIMNLAVNARDAMPRGGRLSIRTRRQTLDGSALLNCTAAVPAGDYWAISVSDTGGGIPDDVLPHIFEPFFTTKDAGRGTGLGLSMVYGIVSATGGAISVTTSSAGTSFDILLPVADGAAEPLPVHRQHLEQRTRRRLLVVDDDPGVCQVVARILGDGGHDVTMANSQSALAMVDSRGPFEAVVTDVVMPGMSGPELYRSLRHRLPRLGAVFMTGYSDSALLNAIPADAPVLRKPVSAPELLRAVEGAC
jgi:PAS domain S-box-containing protein